MPRLLLVILVIAFTVYTVVDVIKTDRSEVNGLPKPLWLLLTIIFPVLGGLAWLLLGRRRGLSGRQPRPPLGPLGPDDDPDFLRGI